MKRTLLLACLIFSGMAFKAQDTTTCSVTLVDTVKYINSISSGYVGIGMNISNDGGTYGYAGYAQSFEAPDTISLKGFCFYALIEGTAPDSVDAELFLPDGPGGAPGTLVEKVRVKIPNIPVYTGPMDDPMLKRCVNFSSAIEIEGDYFLAVTNPSDANFFMARNITGDAAATPTEFNYYHDDLGTYSGWNDLDTYGTGWIFNPIIEPLIEYTFEGTAISTDSVLCPGDTLSVQMIIETGDSVLSNKHYNPNFATYTSLTGSNIFDYGDGSAATVDTFHVYTAGGNYIVDRNFTINTPIWSHSNVSFSCNVPVRVVDASLDLGVDTSVCAGTILTFDAGLGFDSYLWNDMTMMSTLSIDTDTMMIGMYSYYADVTKEFCSASDTIKVNIGDLVVNLGPDTTLCLNESASFTAGAYDSYSWNTGQVTEVISVGPFAGASIETYILTVEDGNCTGSDTLVLTVDNCLGVDEVLSASINVYPNPSNGIFNVDFSELNSLSGSISVLDATGKVIFSKEIVNAKEEINLVTLAKGSYMVQINVGDELIMKKIQIIK